MRSRRRKHARSRRRFHLLLPEPLEPRRLLASVLQSFNPNGPAHSVALDFDADVSASLTAGDVEVFDLNRSSRIPAAQTSLAYGANDVATLTLGGVTSAQWPNKTGLLGDGNYEATLSELAVTPNLSAESRLGFYFFQGDIAESNRTINIGDFSVLSAHMNMAGQYLDGDLNYDGQVNIGDFSILSNRWGSTLRAPLAEPYAVQVGSQTTDSLLVQWTAPAWAGGAVPDGYRLWRSEDGADFGDEPIATIPHVAGVTQYEYRDTNLSDGGKFWYRIRAYTIAEGSTASTAKAWGVTTLRPPTDVTASLDEGGTSITARWMHGSANRTGYVVKLYAAASATATLSEMTELASATPGASAESHTFSLPGGTSSGYYLATVQATNANVAAASAPSVPTQAMSEPVGPWTQVYTNMGQDPGPRAPTSGDFSPELGNFSNDQTVTLELSGLPRHKFATFDFRFKASPVDAGEPDGSVEVVIDKDQPSEVRFQTGVWTGNGIRATSIVAPSFAHNSSTIKIELTGSDFPQGTTWGIEQAYVDTYFPFVELSSDGGTVVEDGTGSASFTATRTGLNPSDPRHQPILGEALTVNLEDRSYEVVEPERPATWDVDFTLTRTITISASQVSRTELVTAKDDPIGEGVEVISVAAGRSPNYFAAPPGTAPAAETDAIDDNVSVSQIEIFRRDDLPVIVNNYQFSFFVYLTVTGEKLSQVEINQEVKSRTIQRDYANAVVGFEEMVDGYTFVDPGFDPDLIQTDNFDTSSPAGWETDDNWVWGLLPELSAKEDLGGVPTDWHSFFFLPPDDDPTQAGDDKISYLGRLDRAFRVQVRDARTRTVLKEHVWGYSFDNTNTAWEQSQVPPPPQPWCSNPRNGVGQLPISGVANVSY